MATCNDCGFAIRGKGHFEGSHHKSTRPKNSKTEKKLWSRQADFERTKASLGSRFKLGSMRMPGSLQVGRCR